MKKAITAVITLIATTAFCFNLEKKEFLHYDYIKITTTNNITNLYMVVMKDGVEIPDLLGRVKILPKVNKSNSIFIFVPTYGIKDGEYEVCIYDSEKEIFREKIFFLSRQQAHLKEPLKVLTFEENMDIRLLFLESKSKGKSFKSYKVSAEEIKKVMDEMKLNTFLMLGGQTTLLKDENNIWFPRVISNVTVLKYLKEKGIQVGAYVMCFLTIGQNKENSFKGYKPNLVYDNGNIYENYKYTSITSTKRIKDIIDILSYLGSKEYIDFLGIDFIRVGDYGGLELLPDFYEEVLENVDLSEFGLTDIKDKSIKGLSKIIFLNPNLKKLFKWYQSVRVGRIIKEIKDFLRKRGINKPLIAFMLGWEAGREHGQDLYMFRDAGVDYSFYMLYEFYSDEMFEKAGKFYLREIYNLDTNIVFGNIVDVILNKGKVRPLDNFQNRIIKFISEFSYFVPNGFFIHDLYRILKGRKGDYSTDDWINSVRRISELMDNLKESDE
ncbi:MAG: hypothetical protein ACPL4C_06095 [Brevinematia bacterium]